MSWRCSNKRALAFRHQKREPSYGSCVLVGKPIAIAGLHMNDDDAVLQKESRAAMRLQRSTRCCRARRLFETKRGALQISNAQSLPHTATNPSPRILRWSLQMRHLRGVRLTNAEPTSFALYVAQELELA